MKNSTEFHARSCIQAIKDRDIYKFKFHVKHAPDFLNAKVRYFRPNSMFKFQSYGERLVLDDTYMTEFLTCIAFSKFFDINQLLGIWGNKTESLLFCAASHRRLYHFHFLIQAGADITSQVT